MNGFLSAEKFREESGYLVDGRWYPRVTKIVNIKAKPALYRFYAEMESFGHGEKVVKISAAEGTLIHETAQAIMLGKNPPVAPAIAPAIKAFVAFFEQNDIRVNEEFVEKRVMDDEYRYAGTIDALALIDGKLGVLDIKTSQAVYRDYNLQTSAYVKALRSNFQNLAVRWILRIDQAQTCGRCGATLRTKGGRKKIKSDWRSPLPACPESEHEWREAKGIVELKEFPRWESDFGGFLGAKTLWEWENEEILKKIGYLR